MPLRYVVSYPRDDRRLARFVVDLLRAGHPSTGRHAVFWDADLIGGQDWFKEIRRRIDRSRKVFVLWCWHAAKSSAMAKEIDYAFAKGKIVIPVLADRTRLDPRLARIHGVDMRGEVNHPPAPKVVNSGSRKAACKGVGKKTVRYRKATPRGPATRLHPFATPSSGERILAAFRPFVEETRRRGR
jgi:hypothetical protein